MQDWVRAEYRKRYCDKSGQLIAKINIDRLRLALQKVRPTEKQAITEALKQLSLEICNDICQDLESDEQGRFKDPSVVHQKLLDARPDLLDLGSRQRVIKQLEAQRKTTLEAKNIQAEGNNTALKTWIRSQYLPMGFQGVGFRGWKAFTNALIAAQPNRCEKEIKTALQELRQPGHVSPLEDPDSVQRVLVAQARSERSGKLTKPSAKVPQTAASVAPENKSQPSNSLVRPTSTISNALHEATGPATTLPSATVSPSTKMNLLSARLESTTLSDQNSNASAKDAGSEPSSECDSFFDFDDTEQPDFDLMDQLIANRHPSVGDESPADFIKRDIGHAPLLSESIIVQHSEDFVPQFGLLGSQRVEGVDVKIFQNTNVPFSTFVCGVQGSGKSHTTACMLENALIPSAHLGRLQAPVSALIFSYGEFGSGGSGFTMSEAASLAVANEAIGTNCVRKITVLTSPTNPAINKFYRKIPGVEILPFKLKAKSLDIRALLTLMAVSEKAEVPLYMAKVQSILRTIALENEDGVFDYKLFTERILLENFDPKQSNMLDLRLGLLESFLDMKGDDPEPQFRPGEVTIIDLSDPFVTSNTACILFKLCLDRFMQSRAPAKMVVLDEAHKYMLNNPGAKLLTNELATLIRMQRHEGVRVIISTQEPTISTDLIALCSVTVIHRFTSPAWYSALKKHINAMDNDKDILRQIECLRTGEALIYAPAAVLGKGEDGQIIKAPGRLLNVNIRMRITRDGGESIMAV